MRRKIQPIRVNGNIAYVPLTRKYEAVVDAADVPLVAGKIWYAKNGRRTVYAVSNDYSGPKPRTVLMHRIIMGDPSGLEVDHADCDGTNNRRSNLRLADRRQNARNAKIRSDNTSGYKGVSFVKTRQKWRAQIKVDGVIKHIGRYDTLEAAAKAYELASKLLHGEFGRSV